MANKKDASLRITAEKGNSVLHTSSECKDNHFLKIEKPFVHVKEQYKKLAEVFSSGITTRHQAGLLVGISTSNVCPFVIEQKRHNAMWSCGLRIDSHTGCLVEHLTMNRQYAVEFYKNETECLWCVLSNEGREAIFKAMDAYLERKDYGVFISSLMADDAVREVWLQVQEFIDLKMAETRRTNGSRRKSFYQDL